MRVLMRDWGAAFTPYHFPHLDEQIIQFRCDSIFKLLLALRRRGVRSPSP